MNAAGLGTASLAASGAAGGRLASEVLPWLGVFAGVVVVLWLAAAWLRRRITGGSNAAAGGFDPDELERLRREGDLTEEQYRAISRSLARTAAGLGGDSAKARSSDRGDSPAADSEARHGLSSDSESRRESTG